MSIESIVINHEFFNLHVEGKPPFLPTYLTINKLKIFVSKVWTRREQPQVHYEGFWIISEAEGKPERCSALLCCQEA